MRAEKIIFLGALWILKIIQLVTSPILSVIFRRKVKQLPPIKNDLLKLAAVDLADKIRKREVTSEQVIKAYIARIRKVNPIINAVNDERFESALTEARKADKLVKEKSFQELQKNFPLLGVPFSVKESIGVKGAAFAVGDLRRKNEKAKKDGGSVKCLRDAGAIPICVTNTPEWCTSFECYNFLNGRSYNPYDLSRTPGGSSGGEAALISSAGSIVGLGSDLAGSIRAPSAFCGIFGHKPTSNVVNNQDHFPACEDDDFLRYLVIGPMARYAKDLRPMMHILSNKNSKLRLNEPVVVNNLKIHYKFEILSHPVQNKVEESITNAMKKALEYFKEKGTSVKEANINLTTAPTYGLIALAKLRNAPDMLSYRMKEKDNLLMEIAKAPLGLSKYTFAALFFQAGIDGAPAAPQKVIDIFMAKGEKIRKEFLDMLGEDGVFFFPTFTQPAFRHYQSLTLITSVPYCQLFNVLGFPSTHVPMGLNEEGLPIGFQVVAAPFQDRLCLAVAEELDRAFGGWVPPS